MAPTIAGLAVNPGMGIIAVGPLEIRFLVTGHDTQGSAAVFEMTVPAHTPLPGPAHSHDAYEETIYGLVGVLTWTVARRITVEPGQALCIPRGVVHRFDNDGERAAEALVILSPAGLGPDYFREVAAALAAAGGGPPDRARMEAILRRHGLMPAGA